MSAPQPTLTPAQLAANRGPGINITAWVSTGIGIAIVFLKLFTRTRITRITGWDDILIFISLAFSIIAAAFVSYSVSLGLGRHTQAVLLEHGPERLVKTAYWQILGYPFNIGAFSLPNVSIAILIVNVLDPNPLRKKLLYIMVWLQVVIASISVILIFVQCKPVQMMWDPSVQGTCWNPNIFNGYNYFVSAYTTVTDIVLAVVPVSVLWKLQMPKATKIGVCIMMGLTLLSAIVTIVKACYLKFFTDRTDPLYNVTTLVLWGLIEQNVVLIAASVPTLRPFFHKASFRSYRSTQDSSNHSHKKSGSSFKLGSRNRRQDSQSSDWELALAEEAKYQPKDSKGADVESHSSQQGIWRTREVDVASGDALAPENRKVDWKMRDILPPSLRNGT